MELTQESIAAYLGALQKAGISPDQLAKAYTQSATSTSGLTYYDLEAGAKLLFPQITPLIQMIPRVAGRGGTATNWRSITGINTGTIPMGVTEGLRGGIIATSTQDNVASYVTIGLEDSVTFEADLAAQNFDDVKALAVSNLLRASRIGEEQLVIGGNGSVALGTCPTPVNVVNSTGGTITSGTYHVRCIALTLQAYLRARVTTNFGIPTTHTYTLGDGTSSGAINGGASQVSADTTPAGAGSTQSIVSTVTSVPGAVAYAWFMGSDGTTNCNLAAITTVNAYTFTAIAGTTTPGSGYATAVGANFGSDRSTNSLVFNGLISICAASGSNALVATSDAAVLTSDTAGGITQINADLKSFWDNYRVGPQMILVNAQEVKNITKKVVAAGGAPLYRFNMDGASGNVLSLAAGTIVGSYLNPFTMDGGQNIKLMLHPNVPPGTIIYYSTSIPYPLSNVPNVLQIKTRRDWYQLEWPLRNRKWEYGVYSDQVLQCYFPPAFGVRQNILDG